MEQVMPFNKTIMPLPHDVDIARVFKWFGCLPPMKKEGATIG
jgi:hypothetical protein